MAEKIILARQGVAQVEASEFQIYSARPDVRFLSKAVQPPSQVYVATGDDLVALCASSQTAEVVTISYRLLRADGLIILGQFQIAPANTRAVKTFTEGLAEGFLLSVSARAAVATTRGQTFLRLFITDPALGSGQPSYMLMADYVTTAMAPAHPGGRVTSSVEGPGWRHVITGALPGVGVEWSSTVPANARWRVDSAFNALGTSAAVANRYAGIKIVSAGQTPYIGFGEVAIPASQSFFITYSKTVNKPASPNGFAWCPLPFDLAMLGGDIIKSDTDGIKVADSYVAPTIAVEEWLDNV